ncbi:hypothetical protein Salat_0830100 [Sesamum alatum]|uniref:HMA domain-containing protein n=1 Tax=Sesamum alatum TaxID=300844 RepID=A0AAE2CQD5_9LAMI|nr:hypothetical protein Salat_0830100 [Sesamum alatum]
MENQSPDHHKTKVLSMNISCCEKCPKVLKKKLLKMPGVHAVDIDLENDFVLVTGTVDAMTLVNSVAKLGKTVHLLPSNKHPKNKNNHGDEKHKDISKEETPTPPRRQGRMHDNCCHRDGHRTGKKEVEEHKCEAYVPTKVDERICRDYYCKVHPKMRRIVDKAPAGSSALFGGLPFYNAGFGGGVPYRGSYLYPGWYGEEQPCPPRFGYRPPPRMLPHPFGFH